MLISILLGNGYDIRYEMSVLTNSTSASCWCSDQLWWFLPIYLSNRTDVWCLFWPTALMFYISVLIRGADIWCFLCLSNRADVWLLCIEQQSWLVFVYLNNRVCIWATELMFDACIFISSADFDVCVFEQQSWCFISHVLTNRADLMFDVCVFEQQNWYLLPLY